MPNVKETLEVARWHLEAGRAEQAEALFQAVLDLEPRQPGAHRGLGQLALAKADVAKAIGHFGLALEEGSEEAAIYLDLGAAYLMQKRFEDAEVVLERAAGLNPDCLATQDAWATAIAEQGELHRARDLLAEALQRLVLEAPDEEAARKQAIAFFDLGGLNQKLGRLDEAVAAFRVSHHYDPKRPETLQNLGVAYAMQQDWEKAVDCLERALLRDPGNPLLTASLGEILLAAGRSEEAALLLRKASKLMPANAEIHQCLARALMASKRWTEAARSYGEALRLKPGEAQHGLELALALKQQGRFDLAATALEQALKAAPDLAAALALKGEVCLARGDYETGFAAMNRALSAGEDGKAPSKAPEPAIDRKRIGIVASEDILTLLALLRFLPALRERVRHLVCIGPTELRGLMMCAKGIDEWASGVPPKLDLLLGLYQLPGVLGIADPRSLPPPYLKAWTPPATQRRLRIGVAAGKAREALQPLLDDLGSEALDLDALRDESRTWQPWIEGLAGLDLVVGGDQIALATAAALGIPGHVIVEGAAHWCWGPAGDASPWYPNVRVHRGAADEAVAALRREIGETNRQ